MIDIMRRQARHIAPATGLILLCWGAPLPAQGGDAMDFTRPSRDTVVTTGIPDAILRAAVASFNMAGTRMHGEAPAIADINGTLGIYRGPAYLTGRVTGEVVVLNGDLRLSSTARVDGRIVVLGGRLTVDRGAVVGDTVVYSQYAAVERSGDGTLRVRSNSRSISRYTSTSFSTTHLDGDVRLAAGTYNRVEGFSVHVMPSMTWRPGSSYALRLEALGIARTAHAPDDKRNTFGGALSLSLHTTAPAAITVGARVGDVISPMADRAFPALESGLGALLFRRDYRDWYRSRSWGVFGDWSIREALRLNASVDISKEQGLRAVDVFSVIRSSEAWRPNPLIDDGRFVTLSVGAEWDTRDNTSVPTEGTFARVAVNHIISHSLTPVTLPRSIRDEMSVDAYAANEINFDLRQYTRLSPTRSIHLRLSGGGWLGGDPLTLQRRRSLGGGDLLSGYAFRSDNCDSRKASDPATPALCDRALTAQVEYRQAMRFDLSTKLGPYPVGIHQPDLVLFGDAGSAWLAGDSVGRVPSSRIQTLSEWRYDVGIGLDAGLFGIYVAKAVTGHEPYRLIIRLHPRF